MNTAASDVPRILTIEVTDELTTGQLSDERIISVPLAWSWRLSNATPHQRATFEFPGDGEGIHWPQIDEDNSGGMLHGMSARPPKQTA